MAILAKDILSIYEFINKNRKKNIKIEDVFKIISDNNNLLFNSEFKNVLFNDIDNFDFVDSDYYDETYSIDIDDFEEDYEEDEDLKFKKFKRYFN
jgi:hypothetical protein